MKVLLYLLVPAAIVAVSAMVIWVRNRQPTSLESGVDAFRREMTALSPDAAPVQRRRPAGAPDEGSATDPTAAKTAGPRPPRRPPAADGTR